MRKSTAAASFEAMIKGLPSTFPDPETSDSITDKCAIMRTRKSPVHVMQLGDANTGTYTVLFLSPDIPPEKVEELITRARPGN